MLFYGQTQFFLQNSLSSYVNCLLIQSAQVDERLRSYGMELIIDTNPILYYILRYVPTYSPQQEWKNDYGAQNGL